jgi:hypothetical protein
VSMPQSVEGTLRDTVRPLLGGTAIRLGNGGCTLGFLAEWAGTDALVTSSHCTIVDWALDSATVHQPMGTGSPIEVGFEVHDPNGVTCGGDLCRASDAAVIKVPAVSSDLGYIARTTRYSSRRVWGNRFHHHPTPRTPRSPSSARTMGLPKASQCTSSALGVVGQRERL